MLHSRSALLRPGHAACFCALLACALPVSKVSAQDAQDEWEEPAANGEPAASDELEATTEPAATDELEATTEPAPTPEASLQATFAAGMGAGSREVRVPTLEGDRRVSTGLFPAVDLSLRLERPIGEHGIFGGLVRYQTSLGLTANEPQATGAVRETTLRAHHVDVGILPAVRFSRSPASVAIGFFLGYGVRALRPVVRLTVPGYTLHGPMAALELRLPLGTPNVVLRLVPEVFAWISTTQALQDLGVLESTGFAFGGTASLHVKLVDPIALELSYHDSRGTIASSLGTFTDVEQVGSLQIALAF